MSKITDDVVSSPLVEPIKAELTVGNINSFTNEIMGKVLTILDASLPEGKQKDATKSLVKQAIWSTTDQVAIWMGHQTDNAAGSFPFYNRGNAAEIE